MALQNPQLARKLAKVLGEAPERRLEQLLTALARQAPELATTVTGLLAASDSLVSKYARLHGVQAEISGDAFSDWHIEHGRIESDRKSVV